MTTRYYLPISEKPEKCGICPACDSRDQWCGPQEGMVNIFVPPPANCPIVEMPDVEALKAENAKLERMVELAANELAKLPAYYGAVECPPGVRCTEAHYVTGGNEHICAACYREWLEKEGSRRE